MFVLHPCPFSDLRERGSCIYMPHDQRALRMGGPGRCAHMHPGFTFAPLLAIALNRQALLVPLHPDHARPLSKLWHGGALGQDHVDLPSFHVQLSPLPDVDILQCQSRRDSTPASQMGRRKAPRARSQRRGFCSSHGLPGTVTSPTCPISLPALQDCASNHLVHHVRACITHL